MHVYSRPVEPRKHENIFLNLNKWTLSRSSRTCLVWGFFKSQIVIRQNVVEYVEVAWKSMCLSVRKALSLKQSTKGVCNFSVTFFLFQDLNLFL